MKKLISVVTPFHNVNLELFKNCCKSMFQQTIGFENVEWVVVVHNSGEDYLKGVHELLDGYDNVIIDVLNNSCKTPSSPRNRGLELVSTDYVGFLDADDQYTPNCLQSVLSHASKSKANITWFRREYELESEGAVPLTEIVLWDQTRDEIIVDKSNWDDEKMFSGLCGMVTSRVYDKKFLDANNIRFDEDVPFGEDFLFNLNCYGHADKVCCLPQLIGYHYFINSGSLVQSSAKNGQTLIAYAKGYKKIIDTGLGFGFYMNSIILFLCFYFARFLIEAKDITFEERITIKNILEPYLNLTTPLKVSKIYSEKAASEFYHFPRDVILNPEKFGQAHSWDTIAAADVKTEQSLSRYQFILRDILYHNQDTDMGRRYGFNDILTLSGYQSKVPVSNYDVYLPMLKLQTNIGETGIITADNIESYVITVSDMGIPRLIPSTNRQIEALTKLFEKNVEGHHTFLMIASLPRKNRFNDNAYSNTTYGNILANFFADYKSSTVAKSKLFSSPAELLFPEEVENFIYAWLIFALSDANIDQIIAPSTWTVWEAFYFLENHWEMLCEDISNGKFNSFCELSEGLRKTLDERLTPNPDRAAELVKIFEQGFDEPVAPKIWKKLTRIIASGTGDLAIYSHNMKRYTGSIQHVNGALVASQALIGTETETGIYKLSSENAFVEFVPVNGGKAVLASQVVPGQEYSLLISTYSGLYRYEIKNRVFKIERLTDGVPFFSYVYSPAHTVDFGDVAVNDNIINDAVLSLVKEYNLPVIDYTFRPNDDGDRLVIMLELSTDKADDFDARKLADFLENSIELHDSAYKHAIEKGIIRKVRVDFSEPETQILLRDFIMRTIKTSPDCLSPVRRINSPAKEKFFALRKLNVR